MENKIVDLQKTVERLKEVWLKGSSTPKGVLYNFSRERKRTQSTLTLAVKSYDLLANIVPSQTTREVESELSYIARDLDKRIRQEGWNYGLDPVQAHVLLSKVEAKRKEVLADKTPVEKRIKQGRLYKDKNGNIFAAQIRDPDRGCSASICSNCDEPIVFCNYICETCSYELIGAHGMVNLYLWKRLKPKKRAEVLQTAHELMVKDIEQRGDWRGNTSPLNRFNPTLVGIKISNNKILWLPPSEEALFPLDAPQS